MHTKRLLGSFAVLLAGLMALPIPSSAGGWPERTVRIINGPLGPGSSIDATARVLAEELGKTWKQSVVVDTRPGADGIIAARAVLEARDGHSLLFTTHSVFTVVPLLREPIPYDSKADFAPISLAVEDFLVIAVPPSLPVDSVAELVSLAKKKPGEMNYHAVPGAPYLAYLAFQKGAGINTTFVPYNSPANAISDLTEGRLHIAVMPLASMLGIAQGGKIKLLAVTNDRRSPTAAHVPTMAEAGYPGFFAGGLLGMFAPRDMPSEVREKIALDMCAVLSRPEIQARLANFGLAARGTTPNEFAAILEGQRTKWAAIAQANNIKPQR